ncbi:MULTISPECIES: hypothetical protein [Helicobacter]|uniref:Uncharacterized protein n=1 Tax=Helicobacter ganmani TaxID=60246 RepID=A0A3D8IGE5_9HELI|nr:MULTISPECIES: hypothetical protein [Helicobacter]RDU63631.1 hypothetical protein CQA43_02040 [Helicobacter ganmani]
MCLLMTLFAAVIASICWFVSNPQKNLQLGTLSLMYWGAGLMWIVDCVFATYEGEPFLNISGDDAVLGAVVVLVGLIAWFVLLLVKNPKRLFVNTF